MTKLTKQEHETIQNLVQKYNLLKIKLGDIEISRDATMRDVNELRNVFSANEKALVEKYGEHAEIDIRTGDIKYPEIEKNKEA